MFKQMKVFECQDMPEDVRKYFLEHTEQGNDCYVSWYAEADEVYDDQEDPKEVWNPVSLWLKDNGALWGEQVLIEHSW